MLTFGQQRLDQRRARGDQVLAVVHHQQERFCPQEFDQRFGDRLVRPFLHAQRLGDGAGHERRLRQRRQVRPPHARAVGAEQRTAGLGGETRLARAAHAGQRQQARAGQQRHHLFQLRFTAHETRQRPGQVGQARRGRCGIALLCDALEQRARLRRWRHVELGAQGAFAGGVLLQRGRALALRGQGKHHVLMRGLVGAVGRQHAPPQLDDLRIAALRTGALDQRKERGQIAFTVGVAQRVNPFVVEIGQQVAAVIGDLRLQALDLRLGQRQAKIEHLGDVHRHRRLGVELHRFAVGKEDAVAQLLAQVAQADAQREARLLIGRVAPEHPGQFLATVRLGVQDQVGEERFHLARVERQRLAVAFQAKRAEEGESQ